MRCGGIILCGGRSTRMGLAKAALPFGPETMLTRVARILGEVVHPVVVVAAAGQVLPELAEDITIAHDRHEGRGPLEGLSVGLATIAPRADAAFVTSCDVPLLSPAFVKRMIDLLADNDIAVPRDGKYHHPLAAVYRTRVVDQVRQLLDADRLRPVYLLAQVRTREVPVDSLRAVDPALASLENVNCRADYVAASTAAGFVVPDEILKKLQD